MFVLLAKLDGRGVYIYIHSYVCVCMDIHML